MDIMNYGLREKYEQLKRFGDRLSDMVTGQSVVLNNFIPVWHFF